MYVHRYLLKNRSQATPTLWVFLALLFLTFILLVRAVAAEEITLQIDATPLNPDGNAYELNPGPDSSLWVSDNASGEIWHYSAGGSALQVFSGLGAVSDARAAVDGVVWFIEQDTSRLGRLEPESGTLVYYPLPPGVDSGFGTALDEQGRVWVSDFSQPILSRFDPASAHMCSYDTQPLASGGSPYLVVENQALWLSDFFYNAVLRLDLQTDLLTRYQYTSMDWDFEAEGLLGDGAGGLWFADSNQNNLVHLDLTVPETPRLLRYRLPAGSASPVMLALQGDRLWYSGLTPPALGRLNPAAVTPTSYTPLVNSALLSPTCSTVQASATQTITSTLAVSTWITETYGLEVPAAGWMVIPLDAGSYPWGITVQGENLWVVDNGEDRLLRLPVSTNLTACKLADADGDPATTADQAPVSGWGMYLVLDGVRQEPAVLTGADGCYTWSDLEAGISTGVEEEQRTGWTALGTTHYDFGVLEPGKSYQHTFVNAEKPRVTACKLADADGDPATTSDQSPLSGWGFYLVLDGVRQQPGVLSGADGCYTWADLEAGIRTGVEEEQRAGWTALGITHYDFGVLEPGKSYQHTFLNAEKPRVTACKLADADGDPATTSDQTPLSGWGMLLYQEDVLLYSGLTGADGCLTWEQLQIGETYRVEEEQRTDWTALSETACSLTEISPSSYRCSFVNWLRPPPPAYPVFLPLILRAGN